MELVTLGGAALRLAPPGNERLESARRLTVGVTGPECNAAAAAGRVGAEPVWLSRLPVGPLGRRVVAELRGQDIEVVADRVEGRQGLSFFERGAAPRTDGRVEDRSGTAVEGLSMEALPAGRVEGADAVYVTAATPRASRGLAGTTAKFLKTATDGGAVTTLGLLSAEGVDDAEDHRDTLEGLFPAVDVFVATADAVAAVFDREGEAGRVMHTLGSTYGFETVALLDEHTGAAWHDSTVHEFARPAVEEVDVTGAVDAFAGAFLARLQEGVPAALKAALAANALGRTTPDPLPGFTAAEVDAVAAEVNRPDVGH